MATRRAVVVESNVTLIVALAAVSSFSAWLAARENGKRWSTILVFFVVALPTLWVVYIVAGLVRQGFGI